MDILKEYGQLTLDLYRAAGRIKTREFRSWAFERLLQTIQFDSAIWIQGVIIANIPTTNNVYLHNQPDRMLEDYAHWASQDDALEAVLCSPGRCFLSCELIDPEARRDTEMYKQYMSKYGIEDALCIMVPFGTSGIHSFLSLYRNRQDKPFTTDERDQFQFIAPHLAEAENIALFRHVHRPYDIIAADNAVAVISMDGHLKMAEIGFVDCLDAGWPDWCPPQLPAEITSILDRTVQSGRVVNDYFIQAEKSSDDLVVSIRPKRPLDRLTLREKQVAKNISEGMSIKEVAAVLEISSSTVTNHVNAIYSKLGVRTRVELCKIVSDP